MEPREPGDYGPLIDPLSYRRKKEKQPFHLDPGRGTYVYYSWSLKIFPTITQCLYSAKLFCYAFGYWSIEVISRKLNMIINLLTDYFQMIFLFKSFSFSLHSRDQNQVIYIYRFLEWTNQQLLPSRTKHDFGDVYHIKKKQLPASFCVKERLAGKFFKGNVFTNTFFLCIVSLLLLLVFLLRVRTKIAR